MNQQMLIEITQQRVAELRKSALADDHNHRVRAERQSLRVRTGWTLVGLGLRLVAQRGSGLARTPRPANS